MCIIFRQCKKTLCGIASAVAFFFNKGLKMKIPVSTGGPLIALLLRDHYNSQGPNPPLKGHIQRATTRLGARPTPPGIPACIFCQSHNLQIRSRVSTANGQRRRLARRRAARPARSGPPRVPAAALARPGSERPARRLIHLGARLTVHCARRSEFNTMAKHTTLLPAPACSHPNVFVSTRLGKLA